MKDLHKTLNDLSLSLDETTIRVSHDFEYAVILMDQVMDSIAESLYQESASAL